MFELLKKEIHPTGWPELLHVWELTAEDVLGLLEKGKPDQKALRNILGHLAIRRPDGSRIFETPEDVGKVPARMLPGLMELLEAAMSLNTPNLEGGPTEDPT